MKRQNILDVDNWTVRIGSSDITSRQQVTLSSQLFIALRRPLPLVYSPYTTATYPLLHCCLLMWIQIIPLLLNSRTFNGKLYIKCTYGLSCF